jgi:hypothetical protein
VGVKLDFCHTEGKKHRLRMFEKKRIGSRGTEVTGDFIMRNFVACTPHKYYYGK